MYPVLAALVFASYWSDTPLDATSTLLASSCGLLASTRPTLVSATSVSCTVSSAEEGELLAIAAHKLAAEHRLVATVTIGDNRFRVRFARAEAKPELPDDGT
jgi:hypothetical protein